ncbi:MAG: class I SAM-dependent methyltransferase [Rhodocyclaceae bacterium]|nr:class I SAM-dependent methyltransferase [Rhodocyclaceae bacterium]MCB1902453.1 class I SAM-dependent methyltransferase [Rhodocyclaceae bacterium]MCP5307991.1 class I SAM-dependent methyltransferase [Zoogloeaceae bacterium]
MVPLLKALAAQLAGVALVFFLLRSGLLGAVPPWALIAIQAVGACAAAVALGSERWWWVIHLCFSPLLLAVGQLGIPPGWYLGLFVLLSLVYWSTFRTRVPLFLSNHATVEAVAALLAGRPEARLLDIGSGTASVLRPLARRFPGWRFLGIESAPLPHLLACLLARKQANVQLRRGDFFAQDWGDYAVIYAFLSPVPMQRVREKALLEMRAGSVLISNSFPLPETVPDHVVEVADSRRTHLYCYTIPSRKKRKGR